MLKSDIPRVGRALKAQVGGDKSRPLDAMLGRDAAEALIYAYGEIKLWCLQTNRKRLTPRQTVERLWMVANSGRLRAECCDVRSTVALEREMVQT